MLQTFDHTQIRILQPSIFPHNQNLDRFLKPIQLKCHPCPINHTPTHSRKCIQFSLPAGQHFHILIIRHFTKIPHGGLFLETIHGQIQPSLQFVNAPQLQLFCENPMQILLYQQQRHMVDIAHIMYRQHMIRPIHMAKTRNLTLRLLLQHLPTPTKNNRRTQPHTPQIPHPMLRRLRLLLLPHNRHERHERQAKVGHSHAELELTQCLEKNGGFNVAHRASHFDEANVGDLGVLVFVRDGGGGSVDGFGFPVAIAVVVDWDLCYLLDPLLDFVGDVGDYLDCLAEVVAPSLLADDLAVHFSGGNVVIARQGNGEETFVVPQV
mmetsp:Transcript_28725/g.51935  ORF Transcript_28725/g.51935 Transcript_28725/m.51935 type:complete len:322 (-) Transcript_28725:279-1244(-)